MRLRGLHVTVDLKKMLATITKQPKKWRGTGTIVPKIGNYLEIASCNHPDCYNYDIVYLRGEDSSKDCSVFTINEKAIRTLEYYGATITYDNLKPLNTKVQRNLILDTLSWPVHFFANRVEVGCQCISKDDSFKLFKALAKYHGYDIEE